MLEDRLDVRGFEDVSNPEASAFLPAALDAYFLAYVGLISIASSSVI